MKTFFKEQRNQHTLHGPHQTALKSITTSFPSFDAFITIDSTSARVLASNTSPPLKLSVVSKQLLEVHVEETSLGTKVGADPETALSDTMVLAPDPSINKAKVRYVNFILWCAIDKDCLIT